MKILVKITREVLEKTSNCPPINRWKNCAIAVAVRQIFPCAGIGSQSLYFHEENLEYVDLPAIAKKFIIEFDVSRPEERALMPEFSFEIDVPNEIIEKIGIGEVYRVLSESKTLEHVN